MIREDDLSIYGPATLGQLIDALAKCPKDREVMFDFCGIGPTTFDSYRGYYDHLALGYKDDHRIRAGELLELAQACVGATYTGWKGGEYRMTRDTPVWVANPGDTHGTGVVDVTGAGENDWRVVLVTKIVD